MNHKSEIGEKDDV